MAFRATAALRQGLRLRPAFELAQRAACLQLVLARWGLETAALMGLRGEQTANDEERKARAVEAITAALYESGMDDHATPAERAMLEKPYRAWEYGDYVYGDHWEAMGVLQWLVGRQHKVPPYYSSFDRARLFQSTGIMPADPSTLERFVDSFMAPQMRQHVDEQQLQAEVDAAEAWSWRARAQELLRLRDEIAKADEAQPRAAAAAGEESLLERTLREKGIPPALRKMAAEIHVKIPLGVQRAHQRGIVASVEGGDFAIAVEMKEDGAGQPRTAAVPYASLDAGHLDALRKIAESRLLAFSWALGRLDPWDPAKAGELGSINPVSAVWAPES
ncbi:hypothetical protein H4R18_002030 [Coemansia javaensis]|uniref:Uncharacterized protein n=1 Tax=Coemansia javaensis TaxID=2761396 RepID=A0A9W8HE35_9FUNG|nr:hypothetical protein H4R18_002030 [Coemansia javaensis]